MSGRCKGCNSILEDKELTSKWPHTLEYTNLCQICLQEALKCMEHFTKDIQKTETI